MSATRSYVSHHGILWTFAAIMLITSFANPAKNDGAALSDPSNLSAGQFAGADLSEDQIKNAQTIISTGRSLNRNNLDMTIALAVALTESSLKSENLDKGDDWWFKIQGWANGKSDSRGLYQQRDLPEWGPETCRKDPACSTQTFFGALDRLAPNRTPETIGKSAQAVQRSAFPDAYDKQISTAQALLATAKK